MSGTGGAPQPPAATPSPKGAAFPSEGGGVRYLAGGITPPPGDVIAALTA